jgi:uncharacterized protein
MPEYLSPGVYIEEIDIGPKPIEGVSTSTAGFLGPTERGPIDPSLITSFEEFQRKFGSYINESYLAYAIDGFFRNGGKRCYISRIYSRENAKFGEHKIPAGPGEITIKTSGPGDWGNRVYYEITDATLHKKPEDPERLKFFRLTVKYFAKVPEDPLKDDPNNIPTEEIFDNLSVKPSSNSYYKNMVAGVSDFIRIWDNFLEQDENTLERPGGDAGIALKPFDNAEGNNQQITDEDYTGKLEEIDNGKFIKSGLLGLKEVEDISLVCAPDAHKDLSNTIIDHCADLKTRFAIVNTEISAAGDVDEIEPYQDNKYGAIYFPWFYVYDPLTKNKKPVPPSGHIAGIYARVDTERGVHKAPANEVVRGIMSLQINIDKGKQDVLNPKGVNVIRSFPGRGNLVWGARTISKDPMWKYINVRRLFIFVEKSVERSTQWAVFEPNNERLWSRVKASLTQFLTTVWKTGALMGTTPEEAFFVRVDRTTMTQNDIDNGKLIVVVGIAPTKPAEFVIFRFAQTQAGAKITEI